MTICIRLVRQTTVVKDEDEDVDDEAWQGLTPHRPEMRVRMWTMGLTPWLDPELPSLRILAEDGFLS